VKRRSKKKKTPTINPLRPGMPAMDSITGIETVGKGKKAFRIIHTSEADQYDLPRPKGKARKK